MIVDLEVFSFLLTCTPSICEATLAPRGVDTCRKFRAFSRAEFNRNPQHLFDASDHVRFHRPAAFGAMSCAHEVVDRGAVLHARDTRRPATRACTVCAPARDFFRLPHNVRLVPTTGPRNTSECPSRPSPTPNAALFAHRMRKPRSATAWLHRVVTTVRILFGAAIAPTAALLVFFF